VSCCDTARGFVRKRRTAVTTEFLIVRILGAAFRTATTKRLAAVTAEPFVG
jgi:hypothetical protein